MMVHKKTGKENFLARSIRLYAARGSMASWGLPFEAIASALLLDKTGKRRGSSR